MPCKDRWRRIDQFPGDHDSLAKRSEPGVTEKEGEGSVVKDSQDLQTSLSRRVKESRRPKVIGCYRKSRAQSFQVRSSGCGGASRKDPTPPLLLICT